MKKLTEELHLFVLTETIYNYYIMSNVYYTNFLFLFNLQNILKPITVIRYPLC